MKPISQGSDSEMRACPPNSFKKFNSFPMNLSNSPIIDKKGQINFDGFKTPNPLVSPDKHQPIKTTSNVLNAGELRP